MSTAWGLRRLQNNGMIAPSKDPSINEREIIPKLTRKYLPPVFRTAAVKCRLLFIKMAAGDCLLFNFFHKPFDVIIIYRAILPDAIFS